MKAETKIYSDFIKNNRIVVTRDSFVYKSAKDNYKQISLSKDDDNKWYAGYDDKCFTKKAAVYYYLTNRLNMVDGMIKY